MGRYPCPWTGITPHFQGPSTTFPILVYSTRWSIHSQLVHQTKHRKPGKKLYCTLSIWNHVINNTSSQVHCQQRFSNIRVNLSLVITKLRPPLISRIKNSYLLNENEGIFMLEIVSILCSRKDRSITSGNSFAYALHRINGSEKITEHERSHVYINQRLNWVRLCLFLALTDASERY